MRILLPLALLLPVVLIPGGALADRSHDTCGYSASVIDTPSFHVDAYGRNCFGVAVYLYDAFCRDSDLHVSYGNLVVHVPILNGWECETGVIVQGIRSD